MSPRDYLRRPYARIIIPDMVTGTYMAHMLEFPGCVAQGASVQQAYDRLEAAAESWIDAAIEMGQLIPIPEEWRS